MAVFHSRSIANTANDLELTVTARMMLDQSFKIWISYSVYSRNEYVTFHGHQIKCGLRSCVCITLMMPCVFFSLLVLFHCLISFRLVSLCCLISSRLVSLLLKSHFVSSPLILSLFLIYFMSLLISAYLLITSLHLISTPLF